AGDGWLRCDDDAPNHDVISDNGLEGGDLRRRSGDRVVSLDALHGQTRDSDGQRGHEGPSIPAAVRLQACEGVVSAFSVCPVPPDSTLVLRPINLITMGTTCCTRRKRGLLGFWKGHILQTHADESPTATACIFYSLGYSTSLEVAWFTAGVQQRCSMLT